MPKKSGEAATPRLALFRDTPKSIKTLRAYYKDRITVPDLSELMGELAGESDRSTIILLATILDDALSYRICQGFCFKPNDKEFDEIFRFEGPLGSFSARIEIAAIFGLIDDATYQQLTLIREMRNACAHSKHVLKFSDPVLANVTIRLFKPLGVFPVPTKDEDLKGPLIAEGTMLLLTLIEGNRAAARKMAHDHLIAIVSRAP